MENREENKISIGGKSIKVKGFTLDTTKIVSFAMFIAVLVVVIVFSLIPVGFDWEKAFTDSRWWTNFAILTALLMFGIVYGDTEGSIFLRNYTYGAFQNARDKFLESVETINKKHLRGLHAGWLQYYNRKKRQRVYEELMYRYQIDKAYFGVLTLPQEQFFQIKENINGDKSGIIKYDGKFYKLNQTQWELCNDIRNGKITVSTIDNDCYFLTENHNALIDDDKLVMKAASQKNKNKFLVYSLRIIMLLAVSALLAGFFVDKDNTLSQQAWFALTSRLLTLLSGVSTGLTIARTNNKIDVFVYKHKTDRNNEFIEDIEENRYIPESEQVKDEKEFNEQEQAKIETTNEEKDSELIKDIETIDVKEIVNFN